MANLNSKQIQRVTVKNKVDISIAFKNQIHFTYNKLYFAVSYAGYAMVSVDTSVWYNIYKTKDGYTFSK